MVLVYLPTKLGHLWGFYVGKYTSTMDDLGYHFGYPMTMETPMTWPINPSGTREPLAPGLSGFQQPL